MRMTAGTSLTDDPLIVSRGEPFSAPASLAKQSIAYGWATNVP